MKIIKPSFELLDRIDGAEVLRKIEQCGRTCYKSEDRITDGSAERFVRGILKSGHESVIEHVGITGKFICDRGVTHEIVRHRIASYSQESTRYCNYTDGKFGGELTFIQPCFWREASNNDELYAEDTDTSPLWCYENWRDAMEDAEDWYKTLIENGATPEQARSVLPNSLKTELVMTANLREWKHFFDLRCDSHSHPQMVEVAKIALTVMHGAIPVIFDDLYERFIGGNDGKDKS